MKELRIRFHLFFVKKSVHKSIKKVAIFVLEYPRILTDLLKRPPVNLFHHMNSEDYQNLFLYKIPDNEVQNEFHILAMCPRLRFFAAQKLNTSFFTDLRKALANR